jgi:hypothetical protein
MDTEQCDCLIENASNKLFVSGSPPIKNKRDEEKGVLQFAKEYKGKKSGKWQYALK